MQEALTPQRAINIHGFFCDRDGTLWEGGRASEAARENFRALGLFSELDFGRSAIVTGGSPLSVKRSFLYCAECEWGQNPHDPILAAGSGTTIFEGGRFLAGFPLEDPLSLVNHTQRFTFHSEPFLMNREGWVRLGQLDGRDLRSQEWYVLSAVVTDPNFLNELPKGLRVDVLTDHDGGKRVHIMHEFAGKGWAAREICAQLNLPSPERSVLSVGNDENDIPLFNASALAGVVANAPPSVLESLTVPTLEVLPPEERGVRALFEQFREIRQVR